MKNIINEKRSNQIITFLNSLEINSKRFSEIIQKQNISIIQDFHQALTHSSNNKTINYEKLILQFNFFAFLAQLVRAVDC